MTTIPLTLAESFLAFPWYTWVLLGVVVVLIVVYKQYQKKMMG